MRVTGKRCRIFPADRYNVLPFDWPTIVLIHALLQASPLFPGSTRKSAGVPKAGFPPEIHDAQIANYYKSFAISKPRPRLFFSWIAPCSRTGVCQGSLLISQGPSRSAQSQRGRSEEHLSELQSLLSISYAVFC